MIYERQASLKEPKSAVHCPIAGLTCPIESACRLVKDSDVGISEQKVWNVFPPNVRRRQAAKGLTDRYFERKKGGLECRYYRLREDLNMKPLRGPRYDARDDHSVLEKLQETVALSKEFMELLVRLR